LYFSLFTIFSLLGFWSLFKILRRLLKFTAMILVSS
jgi:hypothetical protein